MVIHAHLIVVFFLVGLVAAQVKNVTVDDTDPTITYLPTGAWILGATTTLDYPFGTGSSHSLSTRAGATANFTFTGVAVSYWSPLWPYAVNSLISLDGGPGECVDLRDPTRNSSTDGIETVASAPRWRRDGLQNIRHSVVVSQCPSGSFVVVDAFSYLIPNNVSSTTTNARATTILPTSTISTPSTTDTNVQSTETGSSTNNSTSGRITAIAVGSAVAGGFILAGIIAIFVFCRQRTVLRAQRLQASPDSQDRGMSFTGSPMATTYSRFPDYAPAPSPSNGYAGYLFPNGQYGTSAPPNRWTATSAPSFYPNTLTPISEGSPLSDVSRQLDR